MSQYFQAGGHVLWNPSNAVAELFVRSAEALIPVVNQPSGIAPAINDEYEIDMGAFETFVNALVRQYRSTTHLILRSLLEGFIATALVLVERGSGVVPALDHAPELDHTDVSAGPGGLGVRGDAGRLMELAAENSQAMSR